MRVISFWNFCQTYHSDEITVSSHITWESCLSEKAAAVLPAWFRIFLEAAQGLSLRHCGFDAGAHHLRMCGLSGHLSLLVCETGVIPAFPELRFACENEHKKSILLVPHTLVFSDLVPLLCSSVSRKYKLCSFIRFLIASRYCSLIS